MCVSFHVRTSTRHMCCVHVPSCAAKFAILHDFAHDFVFFSCAHTHMAHVPCACMCMCTNSLAHDHHWCTCEYGTPVDDGIDCSSHGSNECQDCTGNFHLSSGQGSNCEANVCICSNGNPVADSFCNSHGGNECQDCTGNFHLSSGKGSNCEVNVCVCPNGNPVADSSCKSHGGNECQDCNLGLQSKIEMKIFASILFTCLIETSMRGNGF